jgi:hypothetical protein
VRRIRRQDEIEDHPDYRGKCIMRFPNTFFCLCFLGWLLLFVGVLVSGGMLRAAEAEPSRERPMLLANYYTWYHDGSHPKRAWSGWTRKESKTNPRALAKQREGEPPPSSAIRPLVGLYDSRDRAVADWHVALAKAAGIDALLVDWWGTHLDRDKNAEAGIIAACEAGGLSWAILDERAQFHHDLDAYAGWVVEAMKRYVAMPHYLKIDGRPVWYLYQVAQNPGLTPDQFTLLRRRVEREVGEIYWIVDKIEHDHTEARAGNVAREKRIPVQWLRVEEVDAFAFYSTFSNFRADRYEQLVGRYRHLTNLAHRAGKRMMLPVHPGHDNSYFRDDGDFYVMPRRNGQTLRDYLRAASDAGADYIMVTSWNEWPESTVIEPSADWDDPYHDLRILAQWRGKEFVPIPPPNEQALGAGS